MKISLLPVFCLIALLCSCAKNDVLSERDDEANKLALKHHLVLEKSSVTKKTTKNFNTLAELDKYLVKRDSLLQANNSKLDSKTIQFKGTLNSQISNATSGYDFAVGYPETEFYTKFSIYRPYFRQLEGAGFPGMAELGINWGNSGSVAFFDLIYNGGTFGTFAYANMSMQMQGVVAKIYGSYTEVYSVGGTYNYYSRYGTDFTGYADGYSPTTAAMNCTLTYTKTQ